MPLLLCSHWRQALAALSSMLPEETRNRLDRASAVPRTKYPTTAQNASRFQELHKFRRIQV